MCCYDAINLPYKTLRSIRSHVEKGLQECLDAYIFRSFCLAWWTSRPFKDCYLFAAAWTWCFRSSNSGWTKCTHWLITSCWLYDCDMLECWILMHWDQSDWKAGNLWPNTSQTPQAAPTALTAPLTYVEANWVQDKSKAMVDAVICAIVQVSFTSTADPAKSVVPSSPFAPPSASSSKVPRSY